MKFNLEGLTVYFPYEYIYPEQYRCVSFRLCLLAHRAETPAAVHVGLLLRLEGQGEA